LSAVARRLDWLGRFWEHDHGLAFLAGLLTGIVFGAPIVHLATPGRIVVDVALSVLLLTGVAAVAQSGLSRAVLGGVALVALATRWAYVLVPGVEETPVGAATSLAFCAVLVVVVGSRVFRDGEVTVHRILGAVALYLLFGLAWLFAYEGLALFDPEAFAYSVAPATAVERTSKLVYFSFVTLTTVGYGDVTALHPLGRSLAMLEALTGQLFPAITLARLVALEVGRPR
jgi:Ion channel